MARNDSQPRRSILPLTREQIAARAARELHNGEYVNLGVGIPTLVANYIPPGIQVVLHSGHGVLGLGPFPTSEEARPGPRQR